jgi:hypothetical protein
MKGQIRKTATSLSALMSGIRKLTFRISQRHGLRRRKNGLVSPDSKKAARFPRKLWFDEYGKYSDTPNANLKLWGWFMSAPLLFDPTGGVVFDPNTNEGTKLTKLGSEGRSTSTTITVFSILNRLHDAGYPVKDQKVLSFTDNVQDAALQAGHFNDFTQVVQLLFCDL